MKNFKKIIASFVILISFLALTPVAANAEWQKKGTYWTYTESGTLKTGWLKDSDTWYYFNKSGNMLTGWIIDNGTWYYMLEDGRLDNSKTTTTIPNEIQLTSNIIKPFANGLNLKYKGKGFVNDKDGFNSYGIKDKWMLFFTSTNEYGDGTDFYFAYDPYNCKVYKLYDNLTINYIGQGNMTNIISKDKSMEIVRNYLTENKINIPNLLLGAVDEKDNTYLVVCYSKNIDHVNTVSMYYVDKTSCNVIKSGAY